MAGRTAGRRENFIGGRRIVWVSGSAAVGRNRIRFSSALERLEDWLARVGDVCAGSDRAWAGARIYSSARECSVISEGTVVMGRDLSLRRHPRGALFPRVGAESAAAPHRPDRRLDRRVGAVRAIPLQQKIRALQLAVRDSGDDRRNFLWKGLAEAEAC